MKNFWLGEIKKRFANFETVTEFIKWQTGNCIKWIIELRLKKKMLKRNWFRGIIVGEESDNYFHRLVGTIWNPIGL